MLYLCGASLHARFVVGIEEAPCILLGDEDDDDKWEAIVGSEKVQ